MIKKILEIYHVWKVWEKKHNSNINQNLSSRQFLWKSRKKLNVSFDDIFRSLNANV